MNDQPVSEQPTSDTPAPTDEETPILNPRMGGRMRWALVIVVLFTLVAVAANNAIWIARTALDTDQFVATFAPLPEDPAVAQALGDGLAERLFDTIDLDERLTETLPDGLGIIVAPISEALEGYVAELAADIINSEPFAAIWETTLRITHTAVITVLEGGERGLLESEDGTVSLNLSGVVAQIDAALTERGIDIFGENAPEASIVLYESGQLGLVDQIASLIYSVRWITPIAMVLLAAGALALGTDRRRVTQWLGVGLVVAMIISLIEMRFVRTQTLDGIVDPTRAAAVDAGFDIVLNPFVVQTIAVLLLGAAIAATAWLLGPSENARSLRSAFSETGGTAPDTGFIGWVGRNATAVQWGAVIVGTLILLVAPQLTGLLVLVVIVVVAAVAAGAAWAERGAAVPEHVD